MYDFSDQTPHGEIEAPTLEGNSSKMHREGWHSSGLKTSSLCLSGHSCVPFLHTVALFSQNPQEFVCASEPNKSI